MSSKQMIRYRADPVYREAWRKREQIRRKKKYQDPVARAEKNAKQREYRLQLTEAQRAKYNRSMLKRHQERLIADPEYKKRHRAHQLRNTAARRGVEEKGELIFREEIYERDNGICHLCYRPNAIDGKWELDHILPVTQGGTHTKDNVAIACRKCNIRKGNKLIPTGSFVGNKR